MTTLMPNMAQFDENQSSGERTLLPKGDYPLALLEWEQHQTEKGMGLKTKFIVLDGPHKDSWVFEFFNIQHPNADAVRISGQNLKAFVIACGFDGNQDLTSELMDQCVGKPFVGGIGIQKAKPGSQYGDSNRINKFMSNAAYAAQPKTAPAAPGAAPTAAPAAPAYQAPPAAPAAPAAPAGGQPTPPWAQAS